MAAAIRRKPKPRRTLLHVSQIVVWADAFHGKHGRWPRNDDGIVEDGPGLTWCAVDQALIKGLIGLSKGQSLAKVLEAYRKKRHPQNLPKLKVAKILAWADAHHARTGAWPLDVSGGIADAPGETWMAVHQALCKGRRGLPGGSTLAQLLGSNRGVRNNLSVPALTIEEILTWADDHHTRTGRWPNRMSGEIRGTAEGWHAVDAALIAGTRGLCGGDTLPKLLARRRGVRYIRELPDLTAEQIRTWAEDHRQRTGKWPAVKSGPVAGAPGETWAAIDQSLTVGRRGLPGGSSLYRVLREAK